MLQQILALTQRTDMNNSVKHTINDRVEQAYHTAIDSAVTQQMKRTIDHRVFDVIIVKAQATWYAPSDALHATHLRGL